MVHVMSTAFIFCDSTQTTLSPQKGALQDAPECAATQLTRTFRGQHKNDITVFTGRTTQRKQAKTGIRRLKASH
jgi:hypothetical protein